MDNNRVQEAELLKLPGDLLRNIAPRMEKTAVLFTCTQLRRLALETAGSATVVGRFNSVNAAILNNCSSLRALSLCSKAVAACNARKAYVESSIQHEVDDDVLRDMLGMPALAELRRLDLSCTAITDLAGLAGLSALEELYLQYVNGISDLTPLSSLTNLRILNAASCTNLDVPDIMPLSTLTALQHLDLSGFSCWSVTSIEPLRGLSCLTHLNINYMPDLTSITPLVGLTRLQKLLCQQSRVNELSELLDLSRLTRLQKLSCPWKGVPALTTLMDLQELHISHMLTVEHFSVLSSLSCLQKLRCSFLMIPVTNISALSVLQGLRRLEIYYACSVLDLQPLSALYQLTCLDMYSLQGISNLLLPLANLTRLQALSCKSMKALVDVSCLEVLLDLRHLNLSDTPVWDLRPLSRLTRLQTLSCHKTCADSMEPLSALPDLRRLDISNTRIVDLRSVSALTRLELLYCHPQPPLLLIIAHLAPLTGLQELQLPGFYISPALSAITYIDVIGRGRKERDIFGSPP